MKKVSLKNCEPSLCNPEDKFNDLIEEGYSINEALLSIMEDAIVEQKIEEITVSMEVIKPSLIENKNTTQI